MTYLIAELNAGGCVTDIFDRKLGVQDYQNTFYSCLEWKAGCGDQS